MSLREFHHVCRLHARTHERAVTRFPTARLIAPGCPRGRSPPRLAIRSLRARAETLPPVRWGVGRREVAGTAAAPLRTGLPEGSADLLLERRDVAERRGVGEQQVERVQTRVRSCKPRIDVDELRGVSTLAKSIDTAVNV